MDVWIKRTLQATLTDLIHSGLVEVQDWRSSIIQNLKKPFATMVVKNLKDFVLNNDELYHRGSRGVIA